VINRIVVGVLSVAFLLAGLAIAQDPPGGDDPPVRLKKKNRPDVAEPAKEDQPKPADPPKEEPKEKDPKPKDPKAKDPKEGDEPAQPDEPEMDQAEVLNRVGKNMRTSEDRLDHRELTDATRQVQEDILKDLDSLINQAKNGGGGGGADQQQNQNDQQNQDNKQDQSGEKKNQGGKSGQYGKVKPGMASRKGGLKGQQQAKAGQGKKPGGQPQGGQKPGEQQAKADPGQQGGGQQGEKPPQGQNGNQGGGGKSQGEPSKLAEMYKDVWGHLPETMRAEMNAYSREQFMAKYNDLIKQYYSTVAEKSRKKE